jgi:signal transduction histidine kinase
MKLLNRISRSYLIISLVVFIVTGIVVYPILNHIFRKQMDEGLKVEQMLIEQTINYSDSVPDFRVVFGHMIDVTILKSPLSEKFALHDTLMYDPESGEFTNFRHLFAENTSIRSKGYTINIYKSLEDTENLITEILLALLLVFISLMLTLTVANYFIARRVWIPFYRIIARLGLYQIDQAKALTFKRSNIHEFNLLIEALEKMSLKISRDYQNLKEFNENAAHEIQTPLAIIRTKLELLTQDETLSEEQLRSIISVLDATHRISRLNQGLLLISKIENNQFGARSEINPQHIIQHLTDQSEDLIRMKNISVQLHFDEKCVLMMNPSLADTLFSNLISNAIRHNFQNGFIRIEINESSITISNSGADLQDDPENYFERFRKGSTHSDSVGLGLSIARKIAQLYQIGLSYQHQQGIHSIILDLKNHALQN